MNPTDTLSLYIGIGAVAFFIYALSRPTRNFIHLVLMGAFSIVSWPLRVLWSWFRYLMGIIIGTAIISGILICGYVAFTQPKYANTAITLLIGFVVAVLFGTWIYLWKN